MSRFQNALRGVLAVLLYSATSALLAWRAETYYDSQGRALVLARCMCLIVALMIGLMAFLRGLELFDPDGCGDYSVGTGSDPAPSTGERL